MGAGDIGDRVRTGTTAADLRAEAQRARAEAEAKRAAPIPGPWPDRPEHAADAADPDPVDAARAILERAIAEVAGAQDRPDRARVVAALRTTPSVLDTLVTAARLDPVAVAALLDVLAVFPGLGPAVRSLGDEIDEEVRRRTAPPPSVRDERERLASERRAEIDVRRLVVVDSDPPSYEITIAPPGSPPDHPGIVVRCVSADLLSAQRFAARHYEILGVIPDVPRGKGAATAWIDLVNRWSAAAEHVTPSEEASPVLFERQAVEEVLGALLVGEPASAQDFARGCLCVRGADAHLKLAPLLARLRPAFPQMSSADLCEHLRHLEWAPSWVRHGERASRSWCLDWERGRLRFAWVERE